MDGQTLVNLEIFNNNANGGSSGKCFPLFVLKVKFLRGQHPYKVILHASCRYIVQVS